jgi:hypothetical protein
MVYPELGDYHHLTFEEFKAVVIAHLGDVYDESTRISHQLSGAAKKVMN